MNANQTNTNDYIHNNYDWLVDEKSTEPQTPKQYKDTQTKWMKNDEYIEEYRVDPYDFKLYTYKDFFDYYGRDLEWNLQDPRLIIQRKKINDMIFRYKNILPPKNINFLLDKIIETFHV